MEKVITLLHNISHDFTLNQPLDRWEIEEVGQFDLAMLPSDAAKGAKTVIADYVASQK